MKYCRLLLTGLLILCTTFTFGQNPGKEISLTLLKYKDTINNESEAGLYMRLSNDSPDTLIISNHLSFYYKYQFISCIKSKIIDTKRIFTNIQSNFIDGYHLEKLAPGESREYSMPLFFGVLNRTGHFNVKYFAQLDTLNKGIKDPSTAWTKFYITHTNQD